MAKRSQSQTDTIEAIQNTTMTNTQIATKTSDFAIELVSNKEKTSYRMEIRTLQTPHEWNPALDLSLLTREQASTGLNAVARFVSGGIQGNSRLIIVAPEEKANYVNGTGRFAYVRNDYQATDAVSIDDGNGNTILLSVNPSDVPSIAGYRRLYLNSGELYPENHEGVFTARGEVLRNGVIRIRERKYTDQNGRTQVWQDDGAGMFWYLKAASTLLDGQYNLSVSVGPKMMETAQAILNVVNSDNPAEANSTRLYANRSSFRFAKEVRAEAVELRSSEAPVNTDVSVTLVTGGTISVSKLAGRTVKLFTESGLPLKAQVLSSNPAELAAFAAKVTDHGYTVSF